MLKGIEGKRRGYQVAIEADVKKKRSKSSNKSGTKEMSPFRRTGELFAPHPAQD